MNHHWQVRQTEQPHADGLRRWDRAYQLLAEWAASPGDPDPATPQQEPIDASRDLRPRVDPAPGPDPDH